MKILLLTIILTCLAACGLKKHKEAMVLANIFSINTAKEFKTIISASESCPDKLEGWNRVDSNISLEFQAKSGKGNIRYPVVLKCYADLDFSIMVKYSFDADSVITGGKTKETIMSYGHFTDRSKIEINQKTDSEVLAWQVVHGQ